MNRIAMAAIAFAALTLASREAHAGKTTISGSRADWLVQKAAETKTDCEQHPDKYPGDDCQKVANFVAAQFAEVFDSCNEASNAIEHCFAKAEEKKAEIEQKAKDRKPKDRKPKPPKADEKFKVSLVNSDRVDGSAKDAKEILEKAGIPVGDMLNREQVLTEGSINCHPKRTAICKKVHKLLKSKWVFQKEWLVDSTDADEVLVYLVLAKSDKGDEADEGEEEETPDEGDTAEGEKPVKPGKKPKEPPKKPEPSGVEKWAKENPEGLNALLRMFKLRMSFEAGGNLSVPGLLATPIVGLRPAIALQYDHWDYPMTFGCSLEPHLGITYLGDRTMTGVLNHLPLTGARFGCEALFVPGALDAFQKRSDDGVIRDGSWARVVKFGPSLELDAVFAGHELEYWGAVNRSFYTLNPGFRLQFDTPRAASWPFPLPGLSLILGVDLLLGVKVQDYQQVSFAAWPVQPAVGLKGFVGVQIGLPDLVDKIREW